MDIKPKLGFYAGSFKPFHVGHWDVVKQALAIFDRVIVAQGVNPEKAEVQKYELPICLHDVASPVEFEGLITVAMARWEKDYDVTLVRGLRTVIDLTEEQNYIAFLRGMKPDIKVAYFFCHPEVQHVSSSRLRGLETLAPEEFEKYTRFSPPTFPVKKWGYGGKQLK
jgi:pantetheine-phosphate adenylyltransferase